MKKWMENCASTERIDKQIKFTLQSDIFVWNEDEDIVAQENVGYHLPCVL